MHQRSFIRLSAVTGPRRVGVALDALDDLQRIANVYLFEAGAATAPLALGNEP